MVRALACIPICLSILLVRPTRADACGVKVSVRAAGVKRSVVARQVARVPGRTLVARKPIRVGPARRAPVAAGVGVAASSVSSAAASGTASSEPAARTDVPSPADSGSDGDRRPGDASGDRVAAVDAKADAEVKAEARSEADRQAPERLVGSIFFAQATAALSPRARATMIRNAAWLKRHPDRSIVVEGHCNTTGAPEPNQRLSETRAEAVKNFLVEQGVEESRIEAVGFGLTRPEYKPGSSGKNRRVNIKLVK